MPTIQTITAEYKKTFYMDEKHLTININNKLLDEILDENYPEYNLKGLIPLLLAGLYDKREEKIVWERIQIEDHKTKIAPILICPDDMDFYCTVVVVEVFCEKEKVIWKKIGIDQTKTENLPYKIGETVKWLDKFEPFIFDKQTYINCIQTFRQALTEPEFV